MELRDLLVELHYETGMVSLDIEFLTVEKVRDIIVRNNHDYFDFLAIMYFLKECCEKMNRMRISRDYFDNDLYSRHQILGLRTSDMGNKIIIKEELDDEEKRIMEELLASAINKKEIENMQQEIKSRIQRGENLPLVDYIGAAPNAFFVVRTPTGNEFFNKRDKKNKSYEN